ncbi:hypothetical protein QBC45DRAFT_182195 [Copromyces sp. CBS 386.78]|nr:hypothetical protein QBC45DRAFT_182195 [Copromyces sp. CBS 386.78]
MDLANKSDREMMGVDLVSWTLAFIAVALRAYTRLWVRRDCFGVDDILMFMSMACFTVYVAFAMSGLRQWIGHGDNDASKSKNNVEATKFWWACYSAYAFTILFAKLSVSWFLLRLTTINKSHRRIIRGAVIITISNSITFTAFSILQCQPISFFWDRLQGGKGRCVSDGSVLAVEYTCSVFNIVTDLVYALLPAWIVYHLQIELKTRIALMTLMGMGCLASCAVIARMPYFHQQIKSPNSITLTANVAIWSSVELCLAITAGSLATLRPLITNIGRKLGFASATSGSAYDIEHGPRGPPVLLKERTNSMFSRKGGPSGPRGSNAVLLETETAVPFDGAHFSRHVIVTRSSHRDPLFEGDHHSDSTSSWPPKT